MMAEEASMSRSTSSALVSYDDDVFAWSQQQAAALRALARSRRDLPNELDLEHIAEEIEDVGISQLRTVESPVRRLLQQAIKLASSPNADAACGWRQEMRAFQRDALTHYTPAMRQRIDLDRAWRLALSDATKDLEEHGEAMLPLPAKCPVALDGILQEMFDADEIAGRIATALGER
jgi:Domain of unknown function DUF29